MSPNLIKSPLKKSQFFLESWSSFNMNRKTIPFIISNFMQGYMENAVNISLGQLAEAEIILFHIELGTYHGVDVLEILKNSSKRFTYAFRYTQKVSRTYLFHHRALKYLYVNEIETSNVEELLLSYWIQTKMPMICIDTKNLRTTPVRN